MDWGSQERQSELLEQKWKSESVSIVCCHQGVECLKWRHLQVIGNDDVQDTTMDGIQTIKNYWIRQVDLNLRSVYLTVKDTIFIDPMPLLKVLSSPSLILMSCSPWFRTWTTGRWSSHCDAAFPEGAVGWERGVHKQVTLREHEHVSESVTFLHPANSKIEDLFQECQILCICCQTYQSLMTLWKKSLQVNDHKKRKYTDPHSWMEVDLFWPI